MKVRLACLLTILVATTTVSAETWPSLPDRNGSVLIPAQEWPKNPGLREVKVPEYRDHVDLRYFLYGKGRRQPVQSVADWEIRRTHIRAHVQRAMGKLPGPAQRVALDVKQLEEVRVGKLLRRKITFQSDAAGRVPAYLFLPEGAVSGKTPAVLCLHQTVAIGKAEPAGLGGNANQHYALELAERGYVTLAPDYPSLGEHQYDFKEARGYESGSMKAVWDNIRAVDLLLSLPEVDPQRIGCLGHSLGGHSAMFTAVFEPRIRAIVSSCGFSRFHKDDVASWTGPRYMPLIASRFQSDPDRVPFDFTEIVASFAPRPFLASAAERDADFDVTGVRDVMTAAQPIYALYGQREQLQASYPAGSHDFPARARQVAYEFLDKHLRNR